MRSVVGSNDSLVVEVWHPFDEDDGGKDMAAVHLNVMRHMIIDVSWVNIYSTVGCRFLQYLEIDRFVNMKHFVF